MIPREYPDGRGGRKVNDAPQPDTWHPLHSWRVPVTPHFGADMPSEYADMIEDMLRLWNAKLSRNMLRYRYYNGRNVLKDFGISIPPSLLNVETVVGWPQKAVDAMAVRCRFDGFKSPDPEVQAMLDAISQRSRLAAKFRQAAESTLIHSCSFATVTLDSEGKPRIDFYSAERAAARWDDVAGRIAYGIVIDEFDNGSPSVVTLHAQDVVIRAWDTGVGFWDWGYVPIAMGRPTMVSFSYRPTFNKPFGQSRITRAVMSITDSAVREALRTEISAEFFTSPQKYLLGADRDAFEQTTKWEAYIGNIFAVGRDENGDLPEFGQLSQGSMQPHTDYMRSLAARFSGETNVPISTLGVIHDQPASAEAIYAANEPLIIECEDFNEGARDSMRTLALMAIAAEVDAPIADLDARFEDFTVNFCNPAMPSIVSQTDAMVKIAATVPGFAGTDTFWEQIGFPEDMRRKVENEIRRNSASFTLAGLLNERA
ncbi:MAG: phage portal protein [Eggerthellaceae bacterium]|nr:phage portal protein [Eggerthellaceae bacterium]